MNRELQHRPLRSGPRDCSHSPHTLYIKNKIKIRPPARISSKISDDKQLIFFTRPNVSDFWDYLHTLETSVCGTFISPARCVKKTPIYRHHSTRGRREDGLLLNSFSLARNSWITDHLPSVPVCCHELSLQVECSFGNRTTLRFTVITDITSSQILRHHRYYVITDITSAQILRHHRHYVITDITSSQILRHHRYYVITDITSSQILRHHRYYCHHRYYVITDITSSQILRHHRYCVITDIFVHDLLLDFVLKAERTKFSSIRKSGVYAFVSDTVLAVQHF